MTGMKTKKMLSLLIFVCMLSPSVYTYLPSAFIPSVAATSSSPAQTSTQPSGTPLPPGTVRYQNTWNNSQTLVCNSSHLPSQPLVAIGSDSWNVSLNVPTFLFVNKPTGQYVRQNYTLYNNGTFVVSDSAGNSFGWSGLSGIPSGQTEMSTVANSSDAVQSYVVTASGKTIANFSVSYSVKYQFCQPSGIEMTINGNADWGSNADSGTLTLSFTHVPIQVNGTKAWFGNKSGILLGFDWARSISYSPIWNNSTNALMYDVGSSFAIDPTTITTTIGTDNGVQARAVNRYSMITDIIGVSFRILSGY